MDEEERERRRGVEGHREKGGPGGDGEDEE